MSFNHSNLGLSKKACDPTIGNLTNYDGDPEAKNEFILYLRISRYYKLKSFSLFLSSNLGIELPMAGTRRKIRLAFVLLLGSLF